SIPFFNGDDYHPVANVKKMSEGIPLNDDDRHGWLIALNLLAKKHLEHGCIIACSALKEKYREALRKDIGNNVRMIYLEGSIEEIQERLTQRKGHFMPTALLKSQFDILEAPKEAITVTIALTPSEIVGKISTLLTTT
ncbi:MAG: gluconokinase, partial [Eudoraea sp.]|nr:gluconokinase [Eudoraea sp.]